MGGGRRVLTEVFLAWVGLGAGNVLAQGVLTRDLPRLAQADWYVALTVVNGAALLATWWWTRGVAEAAWGRALGPLLIVTALPFLLNVWVQATWTGPKGGLVFGDTLDPDVGLYLCYGRQFAGWPPTPGPPCDNPAFGDGRYPTMEYPQGALGLFAAGALLAGGSAGAFRWVFPLLLLGFTLGCVTVLHALGRAHGAARAATLLVFPLTLAPTVFRLAPVRYDIVPTFFLLLGVYLFTRTRNDEDPSALSPQSSVLAALALAGGALLKWLPGLLVPFVAGYWARRALLPRPLGEGRGEGWRTAGAVLGAAGATLLVALVPFYLWDAGKFWHPYVYQTGRALIGESVWFLVQWGLLDPAHGLPSRPWGEPPVIMVPNGVITVVQVGLTVVPFGLAWAWGRTRAQWAALGLGSVAIFTLTNRIFSPQFVLALGFTWVAALVLGRPGGRGLGAALIALLGVGLANFLVFPLAIDGWPVASAGLFGLAGALTMGGIALTLRRPDV